MRLKTGLAKAGALGRRTVLAAMMLSTTLASPSAHAFLGRAPLADEHRRSAQTEPEHAKVDGKIAWVWQERKQPKAAVQKMEEPAVVEQKTQVRPPSAKAIVLGELVVPAFAFEQPFVYQKAECEALAAPLMQMTIMRANENQNTSRISIPLICLLPVLVAIEPIRYRRPRWVLRTRTLHMRLRAHRLMRIRLREQMRRMYGWLPSQAQVRRRRQWRESLETAVLSNRHSFRKERRLRQARAQDESRRRQADRWLKRGLTEQNRLARQSRLASA